MTQSNVDTRIDALQNKILDTMSAMVDTMARQEAQRVQAAAAAAEIRDRLQAAIYAEIAALTCRKAACRRAQRCRREPSACVAHARAELHPHAAAHDDAVISSSWSRRPSGGP
jgi:hypothetical protein